MAKITELCLAANCRRAAEHVGYCGMHYKRRLRHGHVEQTRPSDWGAREKHPLYYAWAGLRRFRREICCLEWLNDFWKLVQDVGEKPQSDRRVTLDRVDHSKPFGPDNWRWVVPKRSKSKLESASAYQRRYRRQLERADKDYFRDKDYRKHYGVTLAWYERQLEKQSGVCAICGKPETLEIRGKLVRLSVDHCHDTKRARGLLCSKHNRGLGLFSHSQELLVKAIKYLQLHQETK